MCQKSKEEILKRIEETGVTQKFLDNLIGGYRGKLTEWKKGKTTLNENELNILVSYLFDENKFTDRSEAEELYARYQNLSDEQRALIDNMFSQFEKKK